MKNFPSQLKRIKKKIQTEEQGMIVVEATISFMIFLMVVIAIIYLTNIFIVHNKVQFAINSTAHQLSGYSYLYQTLGVRKAEQCVKADGSKYTKPIDQTAGQVIDTMNKIQTFWSDANTSTARDSFPIGEETPDLVCRNGGIGACAFEDHIFLRMPDG